LGRSGSEAEAGAQTGCRYVSLCIYTHTHTYMKGVKWKRVQTGCRSQILKNKKKLRKKYWECSGSGDANRQQVSNSQKHSI
jgi:hypothetical protein